MYDDEYACFYVRYSDALYVQRLKIQLLSLVTNDTNFMNVCASLSVARLCARPIHSRVLHPRVHRSFLLHVSLVCPPTHTLALSLAVSPAVLSTPTVCVVVARRAPLPCFPRLGNAC